MAHRKNLGFVLGSQNFGDLGEVNLDKGVKTGKTGEAHQLRF